VFLRQLEILGSLQWSYGLLRRSGKLGVFDMTRLKLGRGGTDPKPGKDEHHRRDAGVQTGLEGWDDLRNSLGLTRKLHLGRKPLWL
jgi:hypothetical protein